jgi:glycosyltransferase involved in cell wall biosynthesis
VATVAQAGCVTETRSVPKLSAVVSARNEEDRIAACLEKLRFADEIVVLLDRCTDDTGTVAARIADKIVEGAWAMEGERRNAAIAACGGDWILEVDADEHVPDTLAREIRATIETTHADWHEIPVDNYIGERLVRHGWGASYGKAAYPGLFRKGVKQWGPQRVHPSLKWSGTKGAMLTTPIDHYVDRDVSDMLKRLDSYSTARARDLRAAGIHGNLLNDTRRLVSRFFKCYVRRKGYREGAYGLLIALFAGLYPMISTIKSRVDED